MKGIRKSEFTRVSHPPFVFTYGQSPIVGPVAGAGVLAGPSILQSSASTPNDLGGFSVDFGASAADEFGAGADFSFGSTVTTTMTVGFGAGGNGHALVITNTVVVPVCPY